MATRAFFPERCWVVVEVVVVVGVGVVVVVEVGVEVVVEVVVVVGVGVVVVVEVGVEVGCCLRELIIITNLGRILREYPDRWQYENKDLGKLMKPMTTTTPAEVIVSAIMSEKKEV